MAPCGCAPPAGALAVKVRGSGMSQVVIKTEESESERAQPQLSGETRQRLGTQLRLVYERIVETQPIPDAQVDLLLQLRHRERDLRRAG